jgi:membrane protease YdiL (CAAX protease family)
MTEHTLSSERSASSRPLVRVAEFFALTFLVSWVLWGLGAFLGTTAGAWPILSTLAGFGPLVAAGILSWRDGDLRAWAAQAVRWRTGARWWLAALLGAPLLSLAGYGVYVALSGASFSLASGTLPVVYATVFLYVLLLRGGFGEEMGWRGYALPHLLERYSATVAALVVGVGWAVWHLPLFFVQGTRQSGPFAVYLLGVVGLSVVLAWLYVRAKGSVLLVAVFHAQWNVFDSGVLFALSGESPLLAPAASAAVVWAAALLLVALDGETMRSSRPGPAPPGRGSPAE